MYSHPASVVCSRRGERTSNCPGFSSYHKVKINRYTDFLVNEILPDGTVVHLVESSVEGFGEEHPTSSSEVGRPKRSVSQSYSKSESHDKRNTPQNDFHNGTDHSDAQTLSESKLCAPQQPNIDEVMQDAASGGPDEAWPDMKEASEQDRISKSPKKRSIDPPHPLSPPKMAKVKPVEPATEKIWNSYTTADTKVVDRPCNDTEEDEIKPQAPVHLSKPSTVSSWQNFAQPENSPNKASKISNDSPPKLPYKGSVEQHEASESRFSNTDPSFELLASLLGSDVVASLKALYQHMQSAPGKKPRDYGNVDCGELDRSCRTKVHQALRDAFASRLESSTDKDGHIVVSVANSHSNGPSGRFEGRGRGGKDKGEDLNQRRRNEQTDMRDARSTNKRTWEDLGGEYLHFSLLKENKDTMEIISFLSKQLHIKPASFQFAGTKDRRGVTVQRVSVYRQKAERLRSLGKTLRNAEVGEFAYRPNPLQLGELSGNEFVITLRDCHFVSQGSPGLENQINIAVGTIGKAIESLRELGFINYYGLQRFGSFEIRTDTVGVLLLQGNFKAAVDAILAYSDVSLEDNQDEGNVNRVSRDDRARANAIKQFRTNGKARPTLELLPRKFSAEAALIQFLGNARNTGDYLGAIMKIHRNTRLMYTHAYQSLVWNVVASERWRKWGSAVMPGDLVLIKEHVDKVEGTKEAPAVDAEGDVVVEAGVTDRSTKFEDSITRARLLSEDEAKSGSYSIFDVVLPTPGYDILYPANEIGEYYTSFMASDRGGCLEPNDMRRKWADMSLTGSYRKLLARPAAGMTAEIKTYTEENEKFVETDLERLQKLRKQRTDLGQLHAPIESDESLVKIHDPSMVDGFGVSAVEPNAKPEQTGIADVADSSNDTVTMKAAVPRIAVVVRLQLQSGQYATMALREFTKGGIKAYKPDFSGGAR